MGTTCPVSMCPFGLTRYATAFEDGHQRPGWLPLTGANDDRQEFYAEQQHLDDADIHLAPTHALAAMQPSTQPRGENPPARPTYGCRQAASLGRSQSRGGLVPRESLSLETSTCNPAQPPPVCHRTAVDNSRRSCHDRQHRRSWWILLAPVLWIRTSCAAHRIRKSSLLESRPVVTWVAGDEWSMVSLTVEHLPCSGRHGDRRGAPARSSSPHRVCSEAPKRVLDRRRHPRCRISATSPPRRAGATRPARRDGPGRRDADPDGRSPVAGPCRHPPPQATADNP